MKIGPISSLIASLAADQSWGGSALSWTVASNSIGFGAILRPNASGELVESDNSPSLVPGLFIALDAGTGNRRVLTWGGGRIRNDAWSWTPYQPLYLGATPGELSQVDTGGTPVGFAESATVAYFGQVHDSFVAEAADIEIAHTGVDFEAIIEADGAEILWTFPDASTSASPHPDVSGVGAGTTTLRVTPWSALTLLDVGYTDGVDGANLGTEYNLTQQNVTGITNIQSASALETLCTMYNPITALSMSSNAALETVECYGADLETVSVPPSVVRLCLEANALTTINMTACSPTIEDFRAASQSGGGLESITWAAGGAPNLWHWCSHTNAITSIPSLALFPALIDLFLENNDIAGAVTMTGGAVSTARLYGNQITSLNAAGGFRTGAASALTIQDNPITSMDVSGNAALAVVDCSGGSLNEAAVDSVLTQMVANGNASYGDQTLDITDNAVPSAAGDADIVTLEGMGWTVTADEGAPASTAPVLVPASCTPAAGSTGIAVDSNVTATFDQSIAAGSGNFVLYDSGGVVETFAVASGTIDGATITLDPTSDMDPSEAHYILIDAGAVIGTVGGLDCVAVSSPSTWGFTTTAASSGLWSDDFNRADGAPGNGWATIGSAVGAILSNQLQRTDSSGYQVYYNPTDVTIPADYELEIKVQDTSGTYFGIATRVIAGGSISGAKVIWTGSQWTGFGAETSGGAAITITGGNPGTWGTAAEHTLMLRSVANRHTLYINGSEVGYFDYTINNQTGTGIALVGVGGDLLWDDAIIRAVS